MDMSVDIMAKLYERPFEPDFDPESFAKEFIAMCGFSTNPITWLKGALSFPKETLYFLKFLHNNPFHIYESSISVAVKSYGTWMIDFIRSSDEMNFVKI